jgi:hypothetical protein
MSTHSSRAFTALACLALLGASPALTAQTAADQIIGNYIGAVDNLANRLRGMSDADRAQREALELPPLIDKLNPLVAQMKAVYGNPASQQALQLHADRLNTAQTRLQQQQSRVLTGDCNPNKLIESSPDTTPIRVTFQNRTREVVTLASREGVGIVTMSSKATLQPNASFTADTFAMHPWMASPAIGSCLNYFRPASAGTYIISGSLAPTLGPFLANIAK